MRALPAVFLSLLSASALLVLSRAQSSGEPFEPQIPPPPAAREPSEPDEKIKLLPDDLLIQSDRRWGLSPDLAQGLAKRAEAYRAFATSFTSTESSRTARYDAQGEASKEEMRRYAYLLERDADGTTLRESRQKLGPEGSVKPGEVEDEGVFPPAYAWVFLFSAPHQHYFAYRDLGERFEGFHWVRVIQFRGALPFTDGKDIREWEGLALVDAVTLSPIDVRSQPSAQRERILEMFDRWSRSFNIIGIRLAPRPIGYRCRVEFGFLRDSLTFPTELRYDTFRAVGRKEIVSIEASIRSYGDYRFFKTGTIEQIEPQGG